MPHTIRRNGVVVHEGHAPAGWVYCGICKAYEHPRWHEFGWRMAQAESRDYLPLRKYDTAPRE